MNINTKYNFSMIIREFRKLGNKKERKRNTVRLKHLLVTNQITIYVSTSGLIIKQEKFLDKAQFRTFT